MQEECVEEKLEKVLKHKWDDSSDEARIKDEEKPIFNFLLTALGCLDNKKHILGIKDLQQQLEAGFAHAGWPGFLVNALSKKCAINNFFAMCSFSFHAHQ